MNSYTPALSACFAILFAIAISFIDADVVDHLISKDKEKIFTAIKSILLCLIPIATYFIFSAVLTKSATPRALFIAIAVATICSIFTKKLKINCPLDIKSVGEGLQGGTNNSIGVVIACAMAGIISGVVATTGLGSTLITLIVPIAEKSLILALFLTMLCCIVLGMGVPTTANYVIMATITAPILTNMGVEVLAAHMFVFYFGIVADITPPVALAAYAGSAIAKSNPLKTGFTASKLAIGAFIIPYIFAYNPSMLFINAVWYEVIFITITSLIGMFGISVGLQGYAFGKVPVVLRIIAAIGGLLLIIPETITDIIGLVLVIGVCVYSAIKSKNKPNIDNLETPEVTAETTA
jgi:TRAP transporter 4TM/12TM fusion protein